MKHTKLVSLLMIMTLATIVYAASPLSSSGGTFFETFESGSFATNNWAVNGSGNLWTVDATTPLYGTFSARAAGSTTGGTEARTNVSTEGFGNILFNFSAATSGLDAGEFLSADWFDGTVWNNVLTQQVIASPTEFGFALPVGASNNADFAIRFTCLQNSGPEECQFDNVSITGTDNIGPKVIIIHPLGQTFDEDSDVAITVNASDFSGIDTILANITFPDGTSTLLSGFNTGLQSDDFDTNTLGTTWEFRNDTVQAGQTCSADIDTTTTNEANIAIGGVAAGTTDCGFVGLQRIDGDYDANVSFTLNTLDADTFFIMRSNSERELESAGVRVFIFIFNFGGGNAYLTGFDNGAGVVTSGFTTTSDTFGKLRIVKSNSTGVPQFDTYFFNNTDSSWEQLLTSQAVSGANRVQFMQLYGESNLNAMNVDLDDFFISGDNFAFSVFNQTQLNGTYNVRTIVNDTLGNVNDTQTSTFIVSPINDPPSSPQVINPSSADVVNSNINITWNPVVDPEGDTLQFNITLLNPSGTFNTTIVSGFGDASSTFFNWDTTVHNDGTYRVRVTAFENNTPELLSSSGTSGSFTIDNTAPVVSNVLLFSSAGLDTPAEDLNLTFNVFESLGPTSTLIQWFVNGTEDVSFENFTGIDSSNTFLNQTWQACVIAIDPVQNSTQVCSNVITIINNNPTLIGPIFVGGKLTQFTDAVGSINYVNTFDVEVTLTFRWFKNTVQIRNTTFVNVTPGTQLDSLFSGNFDTGDIIKLEVVGNLGAIAFANQSVTTQVVPEPEKLGGTESLAIVLFLIFTNLLLLVTPIVIERLQ